MQPPPDGLPVTITVECRSAASLPSDVHHRVTINADGSITVPHDLVAERIGVALGGYSSCAVLADVTLPEVQQLWPLATRARRPSVRRTGQRWAIVAPDRQPGCCPRAPFATCHDAVAHVCSESHLLAATTAPSWQTSAVLRELQRHRGARYAFEQHGQAALDWVDPVTGPADLWAHGIHPRDVPALAAPAAIVDDALPTSYFVNVAYGDVDADWVADVLPARPDADTAAWLTALDAPHRTGTASEWRAWLRHAIPREAARSAVTLALPASVIPEAAESLGVSQSRAAAILVSFAEAGFGLTHEHLQLLGSHGVTSPRPHAPTVANLVERLRHGRRGPRFGDVPPTELAVMVNILGNQHDVEQSVRGGNVFARDIPIAPVKGGW